MGVEDKGTPGSSASQPYFHCVDADDDDDDDDDADDVDDDEDDDDDDDDGDDDDDDDDFGDDDDDGDDDGDGDGDGDGDDDDDDDGDEVVDDDDGDITLVHGLNFKQLKPREVELLWGPKKTWSDKVCPAPKGKSLKHMKLLPPCLMTMNKIQEGEKNDKQDDTENKNGCDRSK